MNVLLTGGTGFIGSHTAVCLTEAGHTPVLYDNLSNSRPEVIDALEKITGVRPAFVRGDIRDKALLTETLRAHRIDAVIHFAGLKAVGESVVKPLAYYDNNISGTVTLLESMKEAGVARLIFSSSSTVYGTPKALPLTEDMPTGEPTNPYGRTKLMIEEILADLCAAEPAFTAVCLRYFNPIGAHESGLIGEDPNGIPNNLMPYITQTALGRLKELHVFGNDYPTPDGTGEGYSVLDIVNAFERVNHVKVPYEIAPRRAGDPPTVFAKVGKAERLLHWKAKRTLDQMCADSWRWQTQNPHGFAKEK